MKKKCRKGAEEMKVIKFKYALSCPRSSEHKEWLLILQTLQTFDQLDEERERQKDKKKYKKTGCDEYPPLWGIFLVMLLIVAVEDWSQTIKSPSWLEKSFFKPPRHSLGWRRRWAQSATSREAGWGGEGSPLSEKSTLTFWLLNWIVNHISKSDIWALLFAAPKC